VPLANLDERERGVIRECLQASAEGPFFPDSEFETLFGLTREDVRRVLFCWPELDETDEIVVIAINNSINNLLGYPAGNTQEEWQSFISVSETELAEIFNKWREKAAGISHSSRDYFGGLM
jgi:hypothetical protein